MQIDMDQVPGTIKEAVYAVVAGLSDEDRRLIREEGLSTHEAHHGLGQRLRNAWSLWEKDTPLKRDAAARYSIAHADDISGLIVAWAWAKVRRATFDPDEHVKRYHRHWGGKQAALDAG